ncbi:hypothetical protein BC829DRAFT_88180 [Chytridium lagenaria]|nr:hypothetical protein BC829DRAFT_88180 [Chytridium lagenaria]
MYETEGEARAAMDGLMKQGYQVSFAKTDPRTPSTQESFNARLQNCRMRRARIYMFRIFRWIWMKRMETRVDAVNVIEKLNGTYVPGAPRNCK